MWHQEKDYSVLVFVLWLLLFEEMSKNRNITIRSENRNINLWLPKTHKNILQLFRDLYPQFEKNRIFGNRSKRRFKKMILGHFRGTYTSLSRLNHTIIYIKLIYYAHNVHLSLKNHVTVIMNASNSRKFKIFKFSKCKQSHVIWLALL